MSSIEERRWVGVKYDGGIYPFLNVAYDLAQYDSGIKNELGEKALRLLDVITGPDVESLIYTNDRIVRGNVIFKNEEDRRVA